MARLLVQLKLRLLLNALRSSDSAKISFIISSAFAVLLAIFAFVVLAGFRGKSTSAELTSVIFTVFAFGWLIAPIMVFGVDSTLDPATLALYPLRTRGLAVGLLAASFTGFWPLANVIGLLGVTVGLASGAFGVFVAVVAVVLQVLFCIALSRFVTTSLASLLRSRRGRDLAAFMIIPLFALYEFFTQVVPKAVARARSAPRASPASTRGCAGCRQAWPRTPSRMPPTVVLDGVRPPGGSGRGHRRLRVAVGPLARAALVTADTTTQSSRVRGTRLPLAGLGLRGTVAARFWLYQRREPLSLVNWVLVAVITAAVSASSVFGHTHHPAVILASAVFGTAFVGILHANSGRANRTGVRPRGDGAGQQSRSARLLLGQNLVLCVIGAPLVAAVCFALAAVAGDPGMGVEATPVVLAGSAPPWGWATCSLRRCPTRWSSGSALLCSCPRRVTLATGLAASSSWRAPRCWPRR